MSADEFTKLFNYMQKEFSAVNSKLEAHDKRFDDVLGAIAELAGDIKVYKQSQV